MIDISEVRRFAHRLADASGAAILPYFRAGLSPDNKAAAGPFDPVTAADKAGERAIRQLITAQYPGHGIIGEEYGIENPGAASVWVLDPIDGTRSFISGLPIWGTLIALLHEGEAVLGVLDQPVLGERFVGTGTATERYGPRGTASITTRRSIALADAQVWVASAVLNDAAWRPRIEALAQSVRMLQVGGDCYAVAMLAEGHIDMIVGFGGYQIYDIAAHIPIVHGAGGIVTALDGTSALHADHMIASGDPAVHRAALAIMNEATR
jgi:myo-inositol-1(or 4)-monophosphatase